PDGRLLATGGAGRTTVALWDVETGERRAVRFPAWDGALSDIAFCADGRRLVIAGDEGIGVRVLDAIEGTEIARLSTLAHEAVALGAGDQLLAAGGLHGVRVWRMSDYTAVHAPLPHAVHALAFEPSGDRLLTGGVDGTVRVYGDGAEVMRLGSIGTAIRALEFSADGTMMATGDDLGQIRIWPAVAVADVADRLTQLQAETAATHAPTAAVGR
ncbi:MAG: hypothetical protein KDC98_09995, partial [Planctomycetes bacterium]|nr:hypothetical protein [Planctomycetota bacterium]